MEIDSDYGWEIDHFRPLYDIGHLIPMHWQNNRAKGDCYPYWQTQISSDGE